MNPKKIRDFINEMCSHFLFEYNGKKGGVDPFNENDFDIWYGDNLKSVESIDEVMNDKFFEGKSLTEIAKDIIVI